MLYSIKMADSAYLIPLLPCLLLILVWTTTKCEGQGGLTGEERKEMGNAKNCAARTLEYQRTHTNITPPFDDGFYCDNGLPGCPGIVDPRARATMMQYMPPELRKTLEEQEEKERELLASNCKANKCVQKDDQMRPVCSSMNIKPLSIIYLTLIVGGVLLIIIGASI